MRTAHVVLGMICLLPALVFAEPPRQRPGGDHGDRGGRQRGGEDRQKEMEEEAKTFFKEHSPKRWAAFDKMSAEQQAKFMPFIMGRYAGFKWLTRDDADLKSNKFEQYRIEDEIFGKKQDLQDKTGPEAEQLKRDLREKVKELFDAKLAEREHRMKRLEALLAREKENLEEDRKNKEELVSKQFEDVLNARESDAVPMPDFPPRPDRGGERERK